MSAYTNATSGQDTFSHRTRREERLWRTFGYDSMDDVMVSYDQLLTTDSEFRIRWLLHTIAPRENTVLNFSVINMPADDASHSGCHIEGHILLPKKPRVNIFGGNNAAFHVDGTNCDKDGTLEKQMLKRKQTESGAWRIEKLPEQMIPRMLCS